MELDPIPFEQLKDYQGKWVALTEPDQKIAGSGDTLAKAKQEAHKQGYTKIIFFKVLPDAYYIPIL